MEENKEIMEIKDMFVKCSENGDLQLRILPFNAPPYIINTQFNIKNLLQKNMEITAKKFKDASTQEMFKTFIKQFINEEYKRVTSYLDVYVLKSCDIQKFTEVMEVPELKIKTL